MITVTVWVQSHKLADEIVKDVVAIANCDEKSVSVAFEEIEKEDWAKKVYKPDILDKKDQVATIFIFFWRHIA